MSLMFPLIFIGFIVLAIVVAFLSRSPGGGTLSSSSATGSRRDLIPSILPRMGPDGFWLRSDVDLTGWFVAYRYACGDQRRTGSITFAPGPDGHFVFTGQPPDSVEVLDLVDPSVGSSGSGSYDSGYDYMPGGAYYRSPDFSSSGSSFADNSSSTSSNSSGPSAY